MLISSPPPRPPPTTSDTELSPLCEFYAVSCLTELTCVTALGNKPVSVLYLSCLIFSGTS